MTHSIHKFSVRPRGGSADPLSAALQRSLGRDDVACWHDYYIEFPREPTIAEAAAICRVLEADPHVVVAYDQPLPAGSIQVAHRIGVVDNESPSLVALCDMLGIPAVAGKVATTYTSPSPEALDAVQQQVFNPVIEDLHLEEPPYATLVPSGHYEPAATFDLRDLAAEELVELGRADGRNLSPAQMQHIQGLQEELGLDEVTDVLLEALDARWSDHCSHTTWKSHGNLLGRLVDAARATENPNVVSMFHDNAGVWDFYDGWSLVIKAETHNGPSAISAYFGQLTKLGGVLRDILGTGLGADPVGCYEYTATGLPEGPAPSKGKPAPQRIAVETIRAIKEYGNTFGVPMMRSRMTFHPSYRAKPFALGGSIGVIPTDRAQRGRPEPGDVLVLIGGLTGSEGIHGASASSAGSTMDNTAVQIGAPLEQVKFRKAITDLRDADCLRALTDVGGAGLNSAVGEIGEACGVWLNTALVPLKTSALPMWRILLSESQERMILVVPPDRLEAARAITERHQVRTTVVGRFTDTGRYCVFHNPTLREADVVALPVGAVPTGRGELGFDVPYDRLDSEPDPVEVGPPPALEHEVEPSAWPSLDGPGDLVELFARVAGDTEVASQLFADVQYDSTVQGHTRYGPHFGSPGRHRVPTSYWAGRPVPSSDGLAVLATAFDPWLFEAHPVRALRLLFAELLGTMALAGVDRRDIALCDNFYTPHRAEHAGEWLVAMVDELAALVRRFGTPVISGKDSSAGSVDTDEGLVHVPPAVYLTALGKVPSADRLRPEAWTQAGHVLVRIGPSCPSPDVTVAGRALGLEGTAVDDLSTDAFAPYLDALTALAPSPGDPAGGDLLVSGTPISAGGVAARLLRGAMATGLGVEVGPTVSAAELFAEHRGGALVEVRPGDVPRLPAELHPTVIGTITAAPGIRVGDVDVLTDHVEQQWLGSFEERIA